MNPLVVMDIGSAMTNRLLFDGMNNVLAAGGNHSTPEDAPDWTLISLPAAVVTTPTAKNLTRLNTQALPPGLSNEPSNKLIVAVVDTSVYW